MERLNFDTQIFIGENSLDEIKNYSNERICIVTDKFMVESKLVEYVTDNINDTNEYHVYTDVVPDPTIDNVVGGVADLSQFNPSVLIAFGGGSAIDAAKAMKLFGTKLGLAADISLVVVPTTSGTGSEVTNFSVITNPKNNLKYPLVNELLQPDKAILDARLVKSVPPHIVADTGMDVLTHALEAYVSTSANVFSDALAEKAIDLIFTYLERSFTDPEDSEAREQVHYASCIAGIAFNQASLGMCHGIAHTVGGKLHMPHGRINGILLPSVVQYNANESDVALERYAKIANRQGFSTSKGKVGVRTLVNEITSLRQKLKMPASFAEAGFTKDDLAEHSETISQEALVDPTTATNPVQPTAADVKRLLTPLF